MTFPTRQKIDALIALAEKATPGPWEHVPPRDQDGTIHRVASPGEMYPFHLCRMEDTGYSERSSWKQRGTDAEFIAASRSAVPALAVALQEAMEAIASVKRDYHPDTWRCWTPDTCREAVEDGEPHGWCPVCRIDALLAAFEPGDQPHE